MQDTSELERKERESAALFEETTWIVRAAEAQSRAVTADEDAQVLELMAQIRRLEEEIGRLRRHHEYAS
jgi:uncharacterized protein Yka (UPF0111/DUF47 family)